MRMYLGVRLAAPSIEWPRFWWKRWGALSSEATLGLRGADAYRSGRAVGAMALGNSVSPISQASTPDAQERPSAIAQTIRL
jgi:hypothetical protein